MPLSHVSGPCRRLAGVLAITVLGLLFAGPVAAQTTPYAPGGAPVLSSRSPGPGDPVEISGGGFRSGSEVRVVIFSEPVVLGTAVADAAGEVDLDVVIPGTFAAGSEHRIELQGVDPSGDVRILSQRITLAGGSPSMLPVTGPAFVWILATTGVVLIAAGLLISTGLGRRNARA